MVNTTASRATGAQTTEHKGTAATRRMDIDQKIKTVPQPVDT